MFCSSSGPEGSHGQYLPFVAVCCVYSLKCVLCSGILQGSLWGSIWKLFIWHLGQCFSVCPCHFSVVCVTLSSCCPQSHSLPTSKNFPFPTVSTPIPGSQRPLTAINPMSFTVSCNTMNDGCECFLLAVFIKQLQRDCWRSQVCIPPWLWYCGVVMDLLLS